jgi:hypothetical protein
MESVDLWQAKVVELWLYVHRSATFQRQYDFFYAPLTRLIMCASKAPGQEQECPPRVTGRWPVGLKGVTCSRTGTGGASSPELQEKAAQQPPSGGCWLLGTISWQIYKIAQKQCIFIGVIQYIMFLHFQAFQKIHDIWQLFFWGTALRNRVVLSGAVRWPLCYLFSGSCEPVTDEKSKRRIWFGVVGKSYEHRATDRQSTGWSQEQNKSKKAAPFPHDYGREENIKFCRFLSLLCL